jgi:hypothetical protein
VVRNGSEANLRDQSADYAVMGLSFASVTYFTERFPAIEVRSFGDIGFDGFIAEGIERQKRSWW